MAGGLTVGLPLAIATGRLEATAISATVATHSALRYPKIRNPRCWGHRSEYLTPERLAYPPTAMRIN